MILRPVSPASPIGPPTTNVPVGLTRRSNPATSSPSGPRSRPASTGATTCVATADRSASSLRSGSCCEDTTTVSRRTGRSASYSMVTCVLPSGRRPGTTPSWRTRARRSASRCASQTGSGMRLGVSSLAYPNMRPWSPAPWASRGSTSSAWVRASSEVLTPTAMSGDCCPIERETPQDSPSNPMCEEVYPMPVTTSRTICGISTYPDVVTSPATWTSPVVTIVSTATRARGSSVRIASRMESLMRSQILSGCPSVTDSDVKRRRSFRVTAEW